MSLSKKCHILAMADAGFVETVMEIPYLSCTGCSHYHRIRVEAPEWLLSANCPCLECSSNYLLNFSDRLEHWTNGRIGTFAEGEWFDPDRMEDGSGYAPRRPVRYVFDRENGGWGILSINPLRLN